MNKDIFSKQNINIKSKILNNLDNGELEYLETAGIFLDVFNNDNFWTHY